MDGILYAITGFVGVLVGALFPYLGMKRQLKQQREMDSHQWRRSVRSEPLLKLRKSLADMATKQEKMVLAAGGKVIKPSEDMESYFKRAAQDWSTYIEDFQQSLYIQYDAELLKLVNEIMADYHKSWMSLIPPDATSADKLIKEATEALEVVDINTTKIAQAQELINKRLEEL
jgi:hypothetical protein